jgi:pimeloyl-[acyl-carrier protein] methyl ester esterase
VNLDATCQLGGSGFLSERAALWHEVIGNGPDIVLLHGWGLHSEVWRPLVPAWARSFRIHLVDLPGWGRSPLPAAPYVLADTTQAVMALAPPRAAWIGWSLGGLFALQAAAQLPERVSQLVLVASSPRFVSGSGWEYGIAAELLEDFRERLRDDARRTLLRFLSLQTQGSATATAELRILRALVWKHGAPPLEALDAGLRILARADLRPALSALRCPVLQVLGERDPLLPVAGGGAVEALLPTVRTLRIAGAAHLPFLSRPQEFGQAEAAFLGNGSAAIHG